MNLQSLRGRVDGALLALFLALLAASAAAAPVVALREVASGLVRPLELVHAGDGSARLFIVEQTGKIKILQNGGVLATPFLDLGTSGTNQIGGGVGERGLLGLAFHPQYATNGAFYVFYTRSGDFAVTVARYLRSAGNPNLADPASGAVLLTVPHPNAFHNSGRMAFGPDGYLYVGTGDGEVPNNAQDRAVLHGKLLRIAVDAGSAYTIPPGNPFPGTSCNGGADPGTGTCPEIWAYGLRNPWKFSFDRVTGDLLIPDVGQNLHEEVNFQPAGDAGGRNYGWPQFEGNNCFAPINSGCSPLAGHTFPVITYDHGNGNISITGGYRYRGSRSLALRGYYLYGDFGSSRIWVAKPDSGDVWQSEILFETGGLIASFGISSFGEDEAGELYVVRYHATDGRIWALDGAAPGLARADFNSDGRSDILWRNPTTFQNYVFFMDGVNQLPASGFIPGVDDPWVVTGMGDFNGDDRTDILWRNESTGQNYVFFMDGANLLPASGFVPGVASPWVVAGTGDFNGDGKSDILWRNPATSQNYVFFMDGVNLLPASGFVQGVGDPWVVAGIGDFNGDGKSDILWRNESTGQNYVFFMHGVTTLAASGFIAGVGSPWVVAGVADFNGDGKSDILWRNDATGQNYVFFMDGTTLLPATGFIAGVGAPWTIEATGDYNGDRKSDILWRNAGTGQNYVFFMDGTTLLPASGFIAGVGDPWMVIGE